MTHVAAMPKLDTSSSTFSMDAFGQMAQSRYDLRPHHKLTVEAKTALAHSSISHSSHPDTSSGYAGVVVIQLLAGFVTRAHALKSCAANGTVADRQRAYMCFFKDLIHNNRIWPYEVAWSDE